MGLAVVLLGGATLFALTKNAREALTPLQIAWQESLRQVDLGVEVGDFAGADRAVEQFRASVPSLLQGKARAGTAADESNLVALERWIQARREKAEGRFVLASSMARFALDLGWMTEEVAGRLRALVLAPSTATTSPAQPPPTRPTPPPTRPPPRSRADAPKVEGLEFVHVPAGTYRVGSPFGEAGRDGEWDVMAQDVHLPSAYWISTTEVSQQVFRQVIDRKWTQDQGDRLPAHSVTYDEARKFCSKLDDRLPQWTVDLPNEVEWEIACRAGVRPEEGPYSVDPDDMAGTKVATKRAWVLKDYAAFGHHDNAPDRPQSVAQRKPNRWGLYDMHGNVYEWCLSPKGVLGGVAWPEKWQDVAIRGGSWAGEITRCRAGARTFAVRAKGSNSIGFRIVLRSE
jgi:formylglycine-generating enzyme required for sulfatase activity